MASFARQDRPLQSGLLLKGHAARPPSAEQPRTCTCIALTVQRSHGARRSEAQGNEVTAPRAAGRRAQRSLCRGLGGTRGFSSVSRDGGWCIHSGRPCSKVPLLPPPRHHRHFPNLSPRAQQTPSSAAPGGSRHLSSPACWPRSPAWQTLFPPVLLLPPPQPGLPSSLGVSLGAGGAQPRPQAAGPSADQPPKMPVWELTGFLQLPGVKEYSTRTRTGSVSTCAQEGAPTTCPQVPPRGRTQSSWEVASRGDL